MDDAPRSHRHRVLAEFGDDPNRYADAKSRKNYAGTSPITKASGTRRVVLARYARNRRLGDAVQQWAFCSLTRSPQARHLYDTKKEAIRALKRRLADLVYRTLTADTQHHHITQTLAA